MRISIINFMWVNILIHSFMWVNNLNQSRLFQIEDVLELGSLLNMQFVALHLSL